MLTVTLDTNVLIDGTEAGSDPEKQLTYRALQDFHERGILTIGYTSRLREDKANDKDAGRVRRHLRAAGRYRTIPGPFRIGVSRLGEDALVDETLIDALTGLFRAEYSEEGRNNSLWDADHLYGHSIAGRDYFLTYDKPVLKKAPQLLALGIRAWDPRRFIEAVRQTEAALGPDDSLADLLPGTLDRAFRAGM